MHYIKACPSCGKKIRFPLDRGKIRIRCLCGYSFIADPDDKSLYRDGSFDLGDRKKFPFPAGAILRKITGIKPGELLRETIRTLYDYKYKIQNFRILPTSEQRKIIILMIIVLIIIAAVVIIALSGPPKNFKPVTV